MLADFAAPLRWIGNGIWVLAAVSLLVPAGLVAAGEAEFEPGLLVAPLVLLGLGQLFRYGARRLAAGDGPELPVVGSYVFLAAGAAMVAGGIVLVIEDPGGFALIAFGLVFGGVGYLMRRLFATPQGKKAVEVSAHEVGIRGADGRSGSRRQASVIHVDAEATEAEIEAAKRAWFEEQWRRRPDWAEGRIQAEETRSGGLIYGTAGVWVVFTLGALGAALLWGDIAWFVSLGAGVMAAAFVALALRTALSRCKFGQSLFSMRESPARLGGQLEGEAETGIAKSTLLPDGFRMELRCVHRWEETVRRGSSGADRQTRNRSETLWREEKRSRGHLSARSRGYLIPVKFMLPADQPATTLGGSAEGIVWELAISAALPGLDYTATFEVPVLAPGSLPSR